ncbi:phospho-N-acetylmuramoyl-pentapeptide-transferase [Candidatus Babeliales bacterium]|nr:phospho-N-acetylmuramoyl-pentapeptide-transferase [Candidatus Babeliales bacterium]
MLYLPALYNLLHYVSIRAILSLISTFLMSLFFGKKFIDFSRQTFQNQARAFTPANHQIKGKTPTMGGVFIILVSIINILIWSDCSKSEPWLICATLLLFGSIGLLDDLHKVWHKKGIYPKLKFRMQIICSLIIAILWIWLKNPDPIIYIPIFKHATIYAGYFFIPWIMFVLIGTSNAVNLTDGLDGLAIGTLLLNFSFFTGVAYLAGHAEFASYLQMPLTGCCELVIAGATLIGASLGFLWFNAHPAQIFMGDVGSLSLGATLAIMALITRQELLLPITGGIFVAETVSVIVQIFSIKIFGKKVFKMTPLHHHFEIMGWPEFKITLRFYIITLLLCILTGIILKIR